MVDNFCLVTYRVGAVVGDGPDGDRHPDFVPVSGTVIFVPLIGARDAVLVEDESGVRTVHVSPVAAKIVDGRIVHEGVDGVELFAAGPGCNPPELFWTAKFKNLRARSAVPIGLRDVTFKAVPGGTVDLASVTPVAGSPGVGVVQGPPGEDGTDGRDGTDGVTPHIQDGTWWIGGTDTGVTAEGVDGAPGEVTMAQLDQRVPMRFYSGQGFPNGSVAAPVGSIYTDTLATAGAVRWIKTTGNGNTGWAVEYADTGWRDITASLQDGWTGTVKVKRVSSSVSIMLYANPPAHLVGTARNLRRRLLLLPIGFYSTGHLAYRGAGSGDQNGMRIPLDMGFAINMLDIRNASNDLGVWTGSAMAVSYTFETDSQWPTSLPGNPS